MIASPLLHPSGSHEVNELALSGGGAGGSYAASLLKGWSETGSRPTFDVVTGVSTGALIAPLAFLGADYDDLLRDVYTGEQASELARPNLTQLVPSSGLLDPQPLRDMIERYATSDLLNRIAVEHVNGRRLLVVTTKPRRAASGALGPRGHRGQWATGRAGSVPGHPDGVGQHTGRISAGDDRCRGCSREHQGDACRWWNLDAGLKLARRARRRRSCAPGPAPAHSSLVRHQQYAPPGICRHTRRHRACGRSFLFHADEIAN